MAEPSQADQDEEAVLAFAEPSQALHVEAALVLAGSHADQLDAEAEEALALPAGSHADQLEAEAEEALALSAPSQALQDALPVAKGELGSQDPQLALPLEALTAELLAAPSHEPQPEELAEVAITGVGNPRSIVSS